MNYDCTIKRRDEDINRRKDKDSKKKNNIKRRTTTRWGWNKKKFNAESERKTSNRKTTRVKIYE